MNPASGATGTFLSPASGAGFINDANVYAIFNNGATQPAQNSLYAIDFGDPTTNDNTTTGHVYRVDKSTGTATAISTYNVGTVNNVLGAGRIQAAAFMPSGDMNMPEPASGSLLLLALGSVGSGSMVVKRRSARLRKPKSA